MICLGKLFSKKKPKPKSARSKAIERAKKKGLKGLNKPKRLKNHKTASHHVMASEGGEYKYIPFGQKGVKTNQTAGQKGFQISPRREYQAWKTVCGILG